jgi:hypothetical protein
MEVIYPKTLPDEILGLAAYYGVPRLRGLVRDIPDLQRGRDRRGVLACFEESDQSVNLYLNRTLWSAYRDLWAGYGSLVGTWLELLDALLHEIGHLYQLADPDFRDDYRLMGYWRSWPERDARAFARREMLRLADLNEDLFMPQTFRDWGYLGVRLGRAARGIAQQNRATTSWNWRLVCHAWQIKLRCGLHVAADHPLASWAQVVHQTRDGRRWRFLSPAQSARRWVAASCDFEVR